MRNKAMFSIVAGMLMLGLCTSVWASDSDMVLRVSGGTDISLGIGYGAGLRFVKRSGADAMEFGPDFFYAHSEETTNDFHQYTDKTTLTIFAARVNWLKDYAPRSRNLYWIYGVGAAAINVVWEETSPTDSSLGTPLAGGGSKMSDEGTAFGMIFNLGVGKPLSDNMDFRFEMPVIYIPGTIGKAATFVPTLTAGLGFRF